MSFLLMAGVSGPLIDSFFLGGKLFRTLRQAQGEKGV